MALESGVTVTQDRVDEFIKQISDLSRLRVMVGIPSDTAGRAGPINNATLGYIHENGSPIRNIPARPWLYPTVNRMQQEAANMLQKAAEFDLGGEPGKAMDVLHALGQHAVNKLKTNITSGGDPPFQPLKQATIDRKGSSKPLIDTANLLNSITYVIR